MGFPTKWAGVGVLTLCLFFDISNRKAPADGQPFRPQLVLKFQSEDGNADARLARQAAFFIRENSPPTPLLSTSPFSAAWSGYLNLDLRDRFQFAFEGTGRFTLILNDKSILEATAPSVTRVESGRVRLRKGANPLVARYESVEGVDHQVRLFWSSTDFPWEPVPPSVFTHSSENEELRYAESVRRGRMLVAEKRCLACHLPDEPGLEADSMPELGMDTPNLKEAGSRLEQGWMAEWIENPRSLRSDSTMPVLLKGKNASEKARQLAAYLATLRNDSLEETDSGKETGWENHDSDEGKSLYFSLGCIVCHGLEGFNTNIGGNDHLSLSRVGMKRDVHSLVLYMMNPREHYDWSRMPDFQLTREDAEKIARFLISESLPEETDKKRNLAGGNPEVGKAIAAQVGCVNCHEMPVENAFQTKRFEDLLQTDLDSGCLAEDGAKVGEAPLFNLTDVERGDIVRVLRHHPDSLFKRSEIEFAERQLDRLRCFACHERDGEPDLWTKLKAKHPQLAPVSPLEESEGDEAIFSVRKGEPCPSITFAGEKLRSDYLKLILSGDLDRKPRPWLLARMPSFGPYSGALARGIAKSHGFSPVDSPLASPDGKKAEIGERLASRKEGFACVACHGIGERPPDAVFEAEGINFAGIAERLRREYYGRLMHDPLRIEPRSRMPKYSMDHKKTPLATILDGDAEKQFEAIWHYILTFDGKGPSRSKN